jgi:hypothetical protein
MNSSSIPGRSTQFTPEISMNSLTNDCQMPITLPGGFLPDYSHSSKIGAWDQMCWPTYSTSNLQPNLPNLRHQTALSMTIPKSPPIPIFAIRPKDLLDHQGPLKSSKTSTRSSPLLLQLNQRWTSQSQALPQEIDDGYELPSTQGP